MYHCRENSQKYNRKEKYDAHTSRVSKVLDYSTAEVRSRDFETKQGLALFIEHEYSAPVHDENSRKIYTFDFHFSNPW